MRRGFWRALSILAALATSAYLPWLADDRAAEATILGAANDERTLAEAAKRADEAMQLNPLAIEPVVSAIAIAQKRGRYGEVADLLEEAVDRQPENPDVWLRAYLVQVFVDDTPARIRTARRVLQLDPHDRNVKLGIGDRRRRRALGERHRHAAPGRGGHRGAAGDRAARAGGASAHRAAAPRLLGRHDGQPRRRDARVRSRPSLRVIWGSQPSSPRARVGSIAMCWISPRRGGANSGSNPSDSAISRSAFTSWMTDVCTPRPTLNGPVACVFAAARFARTTSPT